MTIVTVKRKQGHIVEVNCDGHTGYGVSGEDIVCAALSSIVQTAVLGLMQVAGIKIDLIRDDDKGILNFKLPELMEDDRHNADMILDTMLLGVSDLYEGYSDFIELEVK